MKPWIVGLTAVAAVALSTRSHPATSDVTVPTIYVGQFQPIAPNSPGFGPIHLIKSELRTQRTDANAAALSQAVIEALSAAHVRVLPLPSKGPLPDSGWLVSGLFYSLDEGGHLISIPFLSSHKMPDVEVTVTIADCSKEPHIPFAIMGTDAVLKGQKAPVGWNPYVVGARFVVHKVEGEQSLKTLGAQIAQQILQSRSGLAAHAPVSAATQP
jgi:hypothetical protein